MRIPFFSNQTMLYIPTWTGSCYSWQGCSQSLLSSSKSAPPKPCLGERLQENTLKQKLWVSVNKKTL